MMASFFKLVSASALSAILLTACGGGGGGSGGPNGTGGGDYEGDGIDSPLTFHPRAGYQARIQNGVSDDFTIVYTFPGGRCEGNANFTTQPAVHEMFEGQDSLAVAQVGELSCQGQTLSKATGTTYYEPSDYGELGLQNSSSNGQTEYSIFSGLPSSPPPALPVDVKTNDPGGSLGTLTVYKDNSKSTPMGKRVLSYAIKKDNATNAILVIKNDLYDMNNTLQTTSTSSYQMAADGTLSYKSLNVSDNAGKTIVYTSVK